MAVLAVALPPWLSAGAAGAQWRVYPLNSAEPATGIAMVDGAVWITADASLERISFDGKITPINTEDLYLYNITSGGGRLFMSSFTLVVNLVAYSPLTRELIVYSAVGPSGDELVAGQLAWAPTGDLWFPEQEHIGRLEPLGKIVEYATASPPTGALVVGADKALWYSLNGIIARIDPVTFRTSQVALPPDSCNSVEGSTYSLAASPAGYVYAACFNNPYSPTSYFYRIDPRSLRVRSYGPFLVRVYGMAVGPDENLYLANGYPNALAYFDPRQGIIGYYYTPNGDGVGALTLGPDGNVWAAMGETPAIGTLILRRRHP
jgi:streptogramin lyase